MESSFIILRKVEHYPEATNGAAYTEYVCKFTDSYGDIFHLSLKKGGLLTQFNIESINRVNNLEALEKKGKDILFLVEKLKAILALEKL